ncbi:MAG: GAF domain-containing protein [Armatimonadetes bacterium]|nr:GAF domain-containing protein [Armatimonadota bacterium]
MPTPSPNRISPAALLEAAASLARASSVEEIAHALAGHLNRLSPVGEWRLYVREAGERLKLAACYCERPEAGGRYELRIPSCPRCWPYRSQPEAGGLIIPLGAEGISVGVLQTAGPPSGIPGKAQKIVEAFACHIAIALRRIRASERLHRRVSAMSAGQELVREAAGVIDIKSVAGRAARLACPHIGAAACHVLLREEAGGSLALSASSGPLDEETKALLARIASQPDSLPGLRDGESEQERSALIAPMVSNQETIGLIVARNLDGRGFGEDEAEWLSRFAEYASLVIERLRLQSKLLNEAVLRGALTKADELKSDFIAAVSHELRTPLTAIRGYMDMLLSGDAGEVNETQAQFLETISRNTDRLTARITDLLDISRIEAQQLSLDVRPVRLSALAEQAAAALAGPIRERRISVTAAVPESFPEVAADPKSLLQILTHLLSNAVKYSDPGSPVEILARDYGEQAVITVADKGVGIPEEQQPFLFEKFYRIDPESTRAAQGTGLGLAITRSLVEQQGGHIWVESKPGEGSRFSFTLPKASKET